LLLAFGGGTWWWVARANGSAAGKYKTVKVQRGPLTAAVAASGTLNAVTTVQVGSQISGQIREIHADFNTPVKKGQVIARIDPATPELRVNQSRADLEAARSAVQVSLSTLKAQEAELSRVKVTLADTQRDYERKQSLLERNFISPAERDKAKALYDAAVEQVRGVDAQIAVARAQVGSAEAQVKQREATLRQMEVDLERTYIRAPVDGVVISRNVDAGQTVAASLQAPVLFTIAQDLRSMQVEAAIDEADVGKLREGQRATFTVDAFAGRGFSGTITQIRKAPQNLQNVVTYTVIITAANPDLALLPGMTANVRVVVDQRESALKVSNAALRYRPTGAGDARAEPAASPAGGGSTQALQSRVMSEIKLDEGQKAKVEQVFAEMPRKMGELREMNDEAGRRKQAERNRAELRSQISALLSQDQVVIFERILAEQSGRATAGRLWIPGEDGKPRPVEVRLGLSDGSSTEIVAGDVKEGDDVITGSLEQPKRSATPGGLRMF
jgi:HlyD family secretion protein